MLNIRRILAVVILVSIVVLTVVISRHLQQKKPEELFAMLAENVDLALEDLHYTQNENGKRLWTLDADKAEYLRDSNLAKLEAVKLLFYDRGEFGDVHLTADQGEMEQDSRQVDLVGHVVVTTGRGDRLTSHSLHYDDQKRRITTDDPVEIISEQAKLTGTGLQIDIDLERMVVKQRVRVILYPAATEKK